jgi:hypothetical protein
MSEWDKWKWFDVSWINLRRIVTRRYCKKAVMEEKKAICQDTSSCPSSRNLRKVSE